MLKMRKDKFSARGDSKRNDTRSRSDGKDVRLTGKTGFQHKTNKNGHHKQDLEPTTTRADDDSQSKVKKRLFIGNLHESITEDDLTSRFKSFGVVQGAEIRKKNDSIFAFMDIIYESEEDVRKCIDLLNNTKWKGLLMKVQVAKENFIEKLRVERERERAERRTERPRLPDNFDFEIVSSSSQPQGQIKVNPSAVNRVNNHSSSKTETHTKREKDSVTQNKDQRTEPPPAQAAVPVQHPKKSKTVKSLPKKVATSSSSSDDSSSSSSSSSEDETEKDGIPKFLGLGAYPSLALPLDPPDEPDAKIAKSPSPVKDRGTSETALIAHSTKTSPSIPEPKVSEPPKPFSGLKINPKKKARSDLLRIQSLQSRQELLESRSNLIRSALSNIELQNQDQAQAKSTSSKSKSKDDFLNFGDDDEVNGDASEDLFRTKPQFEGTSGVKNLELTSKFSVADERFRIDERFADSDTEHGNKTNKPESQLEKETQLKVLNEVLGSHHSSGPGLRINSNLNRNKIQTGPIPFSNPHSSLPTLVRFDPEIEEHRQRFLLNYEPNKDQGQVGEDETPSVSQTVDKPKSKKSKSKRKKTEDEDKKKDMSEERRVAVADPTAKATFMVAPDLKELFASASETKSTFSLLRTFAADPVETRNESTVPDEPPIIRKEPSTNTRGEFWNNSSNPFKYDSSEDEDEESKQNSSTKKSKVKKKRLDSSTSTTPSLQSQPINGKSKNYFKDDMFKKSSLFFSGPEDSRLKGVFESFLSSSTNEDMNRVTEDFNQVGRAELKAIAKSKVKNSRRKNDKKVRIMKLVRKKKRREAIKNEIAYKKKREEGRMKKSKPRS